MTTQTTYMATIGEGMGDVVVAMPIIRALTRRGPTVLVQRSPRQLGISQLVTGLAGLVREADFDPASLPAADQYFNLRAHRLQTDYFWGGPEFERDYPGYSINDIQNDICKNLAVDADFDNLEPFRFEKRKDVEGHIAFIPGTTYDAKIWATRYWLSLNEQLKNRGHKICMLGQPAYSQTVKELEQAGIRLIETQALQDAVDVLSSVQLVISVDTGLMHIAVQQGTQTLALMSDPIFYRHYPHSHRILSKRCHALCIAQRMAVQPQKRVHYHVWQWEMNNFANCALPEVDRCINSITVEDVLNVLDRDIKLATPVNSRR